MWNQIWLQHKGMTIGACFGVFFGFIYLFFGFWNMLVFACIVSIAIFTGKQLENKENITILLEIWHGIRQKWRK